MPGSTGRDATVTLMYDGTVSSRILTACSNLVFRKWCLSAPLAFLPPTFCNCSRLTFWLALRCYCTVNKQDFVSVDTFVFLRERASLDWFEPLFFWCEVTSGPSERWLRCSFQVYKRTALTSCTKVRLVWLHVKTGGLIWTVWNRSDFRVSKKLATIFYRMPSG